MEPRRSLPRFGFSLPQQAWKQQGEIFERDGSAIASIQLRTVSVPISPVVGELARRCACEYGSMESRCGAPYTQSPRLNGSSIASTRNDMGTKRYAQMCAVAAALDIVGERWTLLIIRDLMTGPKRYNQLLDESLAGIGPNLLSMRLQDLGRCGVLIRETVPGDGRGVRYRLTESGEALRPVVLGLAHWGLEHISTHDGLEGVARPEWARLSVEAMVAMGPRPKTNAAFEFRIDSEIFHVACEDGLARVIGGESPDTPALTIESDARNFLRIGTGKLSPLDAVLSGRIAVRGDSSGLEQCLQLLGLELTSASGDEAATSLTS